MYLYDTHNRKMIRYFNIQRIHTSIVGWFKFRDETTSFTGRDTLIANMLHSKVIINQYTFDKTNVSGTSVR